ncbi:MAG: porin [Porphyromonas sp.]|nr:porin [Porphyromonas sp.]
MKTITTATSVFLLATSLLCGTAHAQQNRSIAASEESLAEQIQLVKTRQDKFKLYLNTQAAVSRYRVMDQAPTAAFEIRQLRIEAKGQINPWLSYHWRQRLNRHNEGTNTMDNLSASVDIAGIGVALSDRWSLFLGRQAVAYGGIEYDLNPIEVYEYADMLEYIPAFLTGAKVAYRPNPEHQFQFQVLNSRIKPYHLVYPQAQTLKIEESMFPFIYSLNWNGAFGSFLKTRYSVSYTPQTPLHNMYLVALGHEFGFGNFGGYFDAMFSYEQLNRKQIVPIEQNAADFSYILKLNYRLDSRWNIFAKGMYETQGELLEEDNKIRNLRTSLGLVTGVEFYPNRDKNLRFFATYIGRYFDQERAMMEGYTHRVSLGFIYQIPMF